MGGMQGPFASAAISRGKSMPQPFHDGQARGCTLSMQPVLSSGHVHSSTPCVHVSRALQASFCCAHPSCYMLLPCCPAGTYLLRTPFLLHATPFAALQAPFCCTHSSYYMLLPCCPAGALLLRTPFLLHASPLLPESLTCQRWYNALWGRITKSQAFWAASRALSAAPAAFLAGCPGPACSETKATGRKGLGCGHAWGLPGRMGASWVHATFLCSSQWELYPTRAEGAQSISAVQAQSIKINF